MPLDQSGILPGRRIRSSQISDLYDLLTGVMTDQPVTLADGLTVVGTFTATSSIFESSSATAVALIAQGTLGQTADIFQVKSYSGGTYFRVDAGGTLWYGTAAVTTNPMTAAADLIVGGAAGVPTRLGKGSALQYLRTNAGTTALEWATLTTGLSNSVAQLSGNVSMGTANTFYDGPSVSCAAGTWLLIASVQCRGGNSGFWTAKLWDGTTVVSSAYAQYAASDVTAMNFPLVGVVTPASTITYKVSVACSVATNTPIIAAAAGANSAGNNVSTLQAVKIGG